VIHGNEGLEGPTSAKFTLKKIGTLLEILEGGFSLVQVEEPTLEVIKHLFGEKANIGKDGWNGAKAISVMPRWLLFVN
jgi:hypothetical protein